MQKSSSNSNLFIIILRYIVPLEKIDESRSAHVEFLDHYYAQGVFIASGPQVPRTGGVIISRCESRAALDLILESDPFAVNNLATYEIIEFTPTKAEWVLNAQ